MKRKPILIGLVGLMVGVTPAVASPVQWTGHASNGDVVAVPDKQAVTVLLFAMADQARSKDAAEQLGAILRAQLDVHVAVVISGAAAVNNVRQFETVTKEPWPTVADLDYGASGRFDVHVWPTTVVVMPDGTIAGHVAGLPKNYRTEVEAHLAFAQGKIDKLELDRRVDGHGTVVDDPDQMAYRHLIVSQRLLEKGLVDQGRKECDAALALHPKSPQSLLLLARVLLGLGDWAGADKALDCIETGTVSPAILKLLQGETLEAQGKWGAAAAVLLEAVKLNPQPAEAWYELGSVYDHLKDPVKAAAAYRNAFEATEIGRKLRHVGP